MTTREIAQTVNKDDRTIQRWAKSISDKMSSINDKMSSSSPMAPADYDLTETIAIIEKGMGKNAAEIWRENAMRNTKLPDVVTRSDLAEFGRALVGEMMKQFIPLIQKTPQQIEFIQDYYTVKGYATKLGVHLNYSEAIVIGRDAAKVSRSSGLDIRKADDERFGQVGSYHIDVLREVFQS